MLRYIRCNIVILMAATVWLMLSFTSCIVCGFRSYTVLFKCPHGKVRYTNQIRTRYRNWRTISATQLQPSKSLLHRVYLNMIRRAQLCIDAGGNHLQHLLWWYILSAFGYCINFCVGLVSSVGIATDYGLDGPGSNPGWDVIFRPSRLAMGPTQPPLKWVSGLSRRQSAAGACCWPLTPL